MKFKLLTLILLTAFLTGCTAQNKEIVSDKIEELEEMQAMRSDPSSLELESYCQQKGGHYEMWNDGGVFCMFDGYGCDPREFYFGRCGIGI